ncbi:MAG: hypothetical protein ABJH04_08025 [Cyclobacteriaceae bacterium]
MKHFRVLATMETDLYLDVMAKDKEAAMEIGRNTDGGDFIAQEGGDWSVYDAIERTPKVVFPFKGFVVVTPTLSGPVIAWSTQDEHNNDIPLTFSTREEAWKEIADSHISQLQDFVDGMRELDETDFAAEDFVCSIDWGENNSIIVKENDQVIIETTLEEWRRSR